MTIHFKFHIEDILWYCRVKWISTTFILLQVVLVANSLPALNDVTAMELPEIVAEAAKVCFISLRINILI